MITNDGALIPNIELKIVVVVEFISFRHPIKPNKNIDASFEDIFK